MATLLNIVSGIYQTSLFSSIIFWSGSSAQLSSSQPPFSQSEFGSSMSWVQAKLSVIGLSLLPEAALSAGDSDSSGGEFNTVVLWTQIELCEVWELFSQSSTDVPALLPCAILPRQARAIKKQLIKPTTQFILSLSRVLNVWQITNAIRNSDDCHRFI